jgi:hypothetical protein
MMPWLAENTAASQIRIRIKIRRRRAESLAAFNLASRAKATTTVLDISLGPPFADEGMAGRQYTRSTVYHG